MIDLKFKKLTLEDAKIFNDHFKKHPPLSSELTFTNLYIWQNYRQIEYALHDEGLIILATTSKEKYFLPPVGFRDKNKIISSILEFGEKNNITKSVKRADDNFINEIKDSGFQIKEDRDNFDYLYKTEDLAFLNGRNYSNKRGFVKKFFAEYYHKYYKFTNSEVCRKNCLELTDKWFANRHESDPTLSHEYEAIKEFLNNYEHFSSTGAVIYVEDQIVAYTFGEVLNKNTFVIHFEKALSNYSGIYQTINKLFAENELHGKYEFINREQDLGLPGLRKAKLSYLPVNYIKKYDITM